MEKRLTKEIREAEAFANITADKHKAAKDVVEDHERRFTRIERKLVLNKLCLNLSGKQDQIMLT